MTPSRTIVITGASDGIGAAAARLLAGRGDRLILVGRSPAKTAEVARQTGAEHLIADFASLAQVRELAAQLADRVDGTGIDALANNAGGIFGRRDLSEDGIDLTWQVDHLAPFLLTHLLLPQLRARRGAVITTSSMAHRLPRRLDPETAGRVPHRSALGAYGAAKLANVLFTRGLHDRVHDEGVSAAAFHPGVVATGFGASTTGPMRWFYASALGRRTMITAEQGGQNLAWFLTGTPGTTWTSGRYYDQRRPTTTVNPLAEDPDLADRLWRRSAEAVGIGA